jgi:hypothetical protein
VATSGSYDHTATAQEIITAALRILSVVDSDTTPTTTQLNDGMAALNLLVKQWMHNPNYAMTGLQSWHQTEQTLDTSSLTAKQSYTLAPSGGDQTMQIPVDILAVTRVNSSGGRSLMTKASLNRFLEWGCRTNTGTPTEWFYQRGLSSGVLWFNVVPSDTTIDYVLTYIRPIQDIDALSNHLDFPVEWLRALKFNLAVELALEYGIEISQTLATMANNSTAIANYFDSQETTIFFQPDN